MFIRTHPPLLLLTLIISFSQICYSHEQSSQPIIRFQQYLQIDTTHPSPNYQPAIHHLSTFAKTLNLQTQTFHFVPNKPFLLISWLGTNHQLPSVLLNSHLDSVPVEPSKWTYPPFNATRTVNGNIYARGAQDDKCIGMQYLEAIKNLLRTGFVPVRTVHVMYVPDEEIGGDDGMARFVDSEEFRKLDIGFMLDEGQASVGDELRVFYADRSPWWVMIKAAGKPGHGSKLFDNGAMENLMKSMEVVRMFRENQFDLVKAGLKEWAEVISVNPAYVKAGTATPTGFVMNMQPSEAEVGYDVRLPSTADPDLLRKRIAEEWAPASRNMTYEIIERGPIRDYMGRPIMTATDDSNPWWSVFKEAIAKTGGKLARPEILPSTTDTRYIRQMGIPALGFSPMTNTPILLHEHNEFLKDTVYLKGITIYESIISSLSSFEGGSLTATSS